MTTPNLSEREYAIHRLGFLDGAIEYITLYAVWQDGEQFVGVLRKPLKESLQPFEEERVKLLESLVPF